MKRYYFHASPTEAHASIARDGLRPGRTASYGPPAVYLFRTQMFAENYLSTPMDVWRVDAQGLTVHPDPEDPAAAAFTEQTVPASRLKYLGTFLDGQPVEGGMKPNAPISILIDRDLSISADGLVAKFLDDVTLFRVLDGEELCIASVSGMIEGGMFATRTERQHGASWAATSLKDVAGWGASWSEQKRLGKDLFVAEVSGRGRVFYRELSQEDRAALDFDSAGAPSQEAWLDTDVCSTGLGCSFMVSVKDAKIYRIQKSGEPKPMSQADVEEYVRKHPLPEVALRPYSGAGNDWFAGVIRGRSVAIGKDQDDGLWRAENRKDQPFVLGAKTKKAAIEAAVHMIERGGYDGPPWRLNKVPAGFERVAAGQTWKRRDGTLLKIDRVGASYATGMAEGDLWGREFRVVKAKDLMADWKRV